MVTPIGRKPGGDICSLVVADVRRRPRVPEAARACLAALGAQLRRVEGARCLEFDRLIIAWHRSNERAGGWMRFLALVRH